MFSSAEKSFHLGCHALGAVYDVCGGFLRGRCDVHIWRLLLHLHPVLLVTGSLSIYFFHRLLLVVEVITFAVVCFCLSFFLMSG